MTNKTKLSGIALAVLAVSGCASLAPGEQARIVGYRAVEHGSMSDAEAQYALGKYYLGQNRAALALLAFTRALEADSRHAEAYNGRATAFMHLGDLERAEADLARAIDLSPGAAHLLNNQGYVRMLRGDYEGAARSLRSAFELEPRNPRVVANWKLLASRVSSDPALAQTLRLSQDEQAGGLEPARAPEPRQPVVSALSGVLSGPVINLEAPRPAPTEVVAAPKAPDTATARAARAREAATTVLNLTRTHPEPAQARIQERPGATALPSFSPRVVTVPAAAEPRKPVNVAGVQRVSFARPGSMEPTPASAVERAMQKAVESGAARVQVANGNGVRGMAARFGRELASRDYEVVRISNATHFDYARTRIYFRDGYMHEALQLSRSLPVRAAVMLDNRIAERSDLQIVLGRDLAQWKVASAETSTSQALQLANAN